MRITPSGSAKTQRGAADADDHFTGEAWIDHLAIPADEARKLRPSTPRSVKELGADVTAWIKAWNENP